MKKALTSGLLIFLFSLSAEAKTCLGCDGISISMPAVLNVSYCSFSLDFPVQGLAPGQQYTWYHNGVVYGQPDAPFPFYAHLTGTWVLRIFDPAENCSVSDTIQVVYTGVPPVADAGGDYSLACGQEFDTIDISGTSQYFGIYLSISNSSGDYVYGNFYDFNGDPQNPNPPVLPSGLYVLTVFDSVAGGCTASDIFHVFHYPEITNIQTTPASCGQADGTASVQIHAGPTNVQYDWSTGATGTSVAGLAPGWYSVTVTADDTCTTHRNFFLDEDPVCKVRIRGNIRDDAPIPDCVEDPNTNAAKGVMLHLLPDDIYTYTDAQGNYEFVLSTGTYTVEFVDHVRFELLCPVAGSYTVSLPTFGGVSDGNDFFVSAKPVKNMVVSAGSSQAVPGFEQTFSVAMCNYGDDYTFNPAASLIFVHDPLLTDVSLASSASSYDPATQTAVWDGWSIYPGGCVSFNFKMLVPASVPLGTVLHFSATTLPIAGDFSPGDNHFEWQQTVVGSFDPNDKQVFPGETEFGGKIFENDTVLHYQVRFQNTGTFPAFTVEIRDTLDGDLDVTSIIPGVASHPYQLRFEGRNILVFRFENINLPDSTSDEPNSHGFATFSIKRKPGQPNGTVIQNRAAIYFDFNAPVITNTVESVLSIPVGTNFIPEKNAEISLFPNPTTGELTLDFHEQPLTEADIQIFDAQGKLLFSEKIPAGAYTHTRPVGHLPQGIYFVKILSGGSQVGVLKFVKQ